MKKLSDSARELKSLIIDKIRRFKSLAGDIGGAVSVKLLAVATAIGVIFAGAGVIAGEFNQDDDSSDFDFSPDEDWDAGPMPDDFIRNAKSLGIEGKGWTDENYIAAHNLKNFENLPLDEKYNNIRNMINPLDPENTIKLARYSFFPYEDKDYLSTTKIVYFDIGDGYKLPVVMPDIERALYEEKSGLKIIKSEFDIYCDIRGGNEDYGGATLKAADKSYRDNPYGFNCMFDYNDWNNYKKSPVYGKYHYFDFDNDKNIHIDNAELYLSTIMSVYDACFTEAVKEFGFDAATELEPYKNFTPVQDTDQLPDLNQNDDSGSMIR